LALVANWNFPFSSVVAAGMSFISLSVGWKINVAPLAGLPSTVTLPVTGSNVGPPLPQPVNAIAMEAITAKKRLNEQIRANMDNSRRERDDR
jgi:hypothetical protein